MNCSTVNIHFQHGNSASPLLYIGYLNSLLRFYVCRWQRRGEGWHLQRNRESCLAAFAARRAVRLVVSHPQSRPVFRMTAVRSPALALTRLTRLSLKSPRYGAMLRGDGRCLGYSRRAPPPPSKPSSPFPLALFPPPFPVPTNVFAFLVALQIWGWGSEEKGQDGRFVYLCICMHGGREAFCTSHHARLEKIN